MTKIIIIGILFIIFIYCFLLYAYKLSFKIKNERFNKKK
jgi:hypothetical protein